MGMDREPTVCVQINIICPVACLSLFIWDHGLRLLWDWIENRLYIFLWSNCRLCYEKIILFGYLQINLQKHFTSLHFILISLHGRKNDRNRKKPKINLKLCGDAPRIWNKAPLQVTSAKNNRYCKKRNKKVMFNSSYLV